MENILSMAFMALVGWVAAKTGVIRPGGAAVLSSFCLYIICPCVNIVAFQVDRGPDTQTGLLVTLVAAVGIQGLYLLVTTLLAKPFRLDAVEQGSLIYSNAGNLIVPLVTAMLGREKILYACAFRVIQIPLMWTHYPWLLNPKAKDEETLALIQHLTPSQRFDKLLENQQVLAEPIVRNGKKATVGYQPDVWKTWE